MNLSNLMQVFKRVTDLDKVSVAVGMSPESVSDDVEEKVGNISDFFLKKSQTWKHLESLLLQSNEIQAVEIVVLMKNYICEGKIEYICTTPNCAIANPFVYFMHSHFTSFKNEYIQVTSSKF